MKVLNALVLATVVALGSSSIALAKHHRHHHHKMMHGMSVGSSGPSGPRMDGGGVDTSRPGGRGVSRKPE
jgi:hypothetical protein